ncbi:MAG: hypothetical protein RR315_01790, partial [Oscillospiraceae bacterium]
MNSNEDLPKTKNRFLTDAKRVVILITASAVFLLCYSFRFEIASLGFGVAVCDAFDLLFDKNDYP